MGLLNSIAAASGQMMPAFVLPYACCPRAAQAPPSLSPSAAETSPVCPPLQLGPLSVNPPVILPPMAGITTYPFRSLCCSYGAALYISEMSSASAILQPDNPRVRFGPDELRSAQIYAVDPMEAAAAAECLILRDGVQHIDLNFGCPARKVLRKGGGAALLLNQPLLRRIIRAVVEVASRYDVCVTAKMRAGIDESSLTFLSAGKIMEEEGISAVIFHARTAEEMYSDGSGRRNWGRIQQLVRSLNVPVVGNGDVFTARDAVDMVKCTGVAGVAVGRGCLGRPWLFRDLKQAFAGGKVQVSIPKFDEVCEVMIQHLEACVSWEQDGLKRFRKWFRWYLRGYVSEDVLQALLKVECVEDVKQILGEVNEGPIIVEKVLSVKGKG